MSPETNRSEPREIAEKIAGRILGKIFDTADPISQENYQKWVTTGFFKMPKLIATWDSIFNAMATRFYDYKESDCQDLNLTKSEILANLKKDLMLDPMDGTPDSLDSNKEGWITLKARYNDDVLNKGRFNDSLIENLIRLLPIKEKKLSDEPIAKEKQAGNVETPAYSASEPSTNPELTGNSPSNQQKSHILPPPRPNPLYNPSGLTEDKPPLITFSQASVPALSDAFSSGESLSTNPPTTPSLALGTWKYLPLPVNEPDPHDEYATLSLNCPDGTRVIGARVRGKKHKHEGTHCDDWFEVDIAGPWTIIAVSDGAGSHKFSRVGAEVACKAAVRLLQDKLSEHHLQTREVWDNETFRRQDDWTYAESDLEFVQQALHDAMRNAYQAIAQAVEERQGNPEHEKILKRPVEIRDLSATLILAVHTLAPHNGRQDSFVMTCHVGDGFAVGVDNKGRVVELTLPDSGDFSSETEFLTSLKKLESSNLRQHSFLLFRPLRALLVMTDGVSDDFFPPNPEMLRLYGDLYINRILNAAEMPPEAVQSATRCTNLGHTRNWEEDVNNWEYHTTVERITEDQPHPIIKLRSIEAYATKLGLQYSNLPQSEELLYAGACGDRDWHEDNPLASAPTPEDKLLIWLDSYHRRGSFDDRTLVAMIQEEKR